LQCEAWAAASPNLEIVIIDTVVDELLEHLAAQSQTLKLSENTQTADSRRVSAYHGTTDAYGLAARRRTRKRLAFEPDRDQQQSGE
jgi:hypothetical protein